MKSGQDGLSMEAVKYDPVPMMVIAGVAVLFIVVWRLARGEYQAFIRLYSGVHRLYWYRYSLPSLTLWRFSYE